MGQSDVVPQAGRTQAVGDRQAVMRASVNSSLLPWEQSHMMVVKITL